MKILEKIKKDNFPLKWANLDYFPDSRGKKVEIYLTDDSNLLEGLMLMFYSFFGKVKNEIIIYNKSWWDFCLDTWDPNLNKSDYEPNNKSEGTKNYLLMLKGSMIDIGYSGSCMCHNWDAFLPVALKCVLDHTAPYSPIFYNEENNFFFYFHHSGSMGFYYKEENKFIQRVIEIAEEEYNIKPSH